MMIYRIPIPINAKIKDSIRSQTLKNLNDSPIPNAPLKNETVNAATKMVIPKRNLFLNP